ncbi:FtsX-like permease family protein [Streptomyces sp. NPDC000983]|uniref:ABC transporter permease n=1 Tax=Streptomyces sp. NPDC000983 TaxID=3154373 RepID=UPI0033252051
MSALGRVVRAGVGRRPLQTTVMVLTTLIAVTASVVAAGVLAASRAPFEQAMTERAGAHLAASFDPRAATPDQLAATARAAGVSEAAGPFRTLQAAPRTVADSAGLPAGATLPELTVTGRAGPGGTVDRLELLTGRWAARPGEIVLAESEAPLEKGTRLSFPDLPGAPTLTVVGLARSVTGTAGAWVTPAQAEAFTTGDGAWEYRMLYRLTEADTDAEVTAGRTAIAAATPEGALTGTRSHLAVRQEQLANALAFVPFVAAFGVLGLVMSVLIIGIVVSGSVGSATRRIGVLKPLGFTPAQVVRAYVAQALVPASVGCALGVGLGNLLAGPVLGGVEDVYSGASATVPWWVDLGAPAVALALVGLAALVPALRAGRLRPVEALTVGRTPDSGRGRWARRLAGRLALPRPVGLGLTQPFARPARAATTAAAVTFATVTVTFAVGLGQTLGDIQGRRMLDAAAPVVVETGHGPGGPRGAEVVPAPGQEPVKAADPADVAAALDAEPATRRHYSTAQGEVKASGIAGRTSVIAYGGDASWAAPDLVSGHWLDGTGQAVVTKRFLDAAGLEVGDTVKLSEGGRSTTVRVVGEAFFTEEEGMLLLTGTSTLKALGLDTAPHRFHVQPDSGTSTAAYLASLEEALDGTGAFAHTTGGDSSSVIAAMNALIATLTLMLVAVAALGVLNTVVLDTRDRVHDLGVMKSLGMTPRQTLTLVLTSVTTVGVLAGAVGVPAGVALHHWVTPLMGDAVGMNLPAAYTAVYAPALLAALSLGALTIALGGALLPAGWAARTDTAKALRTE